MPTGIPPIKNIGGSQNNDYVVATTSGDVPYIQQLQENSQIFPAVISDEIGLSESETPRIMMTSPAAAHPYKSLINGTLVQYTVIDDGREVDVNAEDMPKHLIGWQAMNNTTLQYDDFEFQNLTPQAITDYCTQNNEIALYGKWEDVSMIRVIIFLPFASGSQEIKCKYTSAITTGNSYNENPTNAFYRLSDNYKQVVDYNNPSHKRAIEYSYRMEFGEGAGCPSDVDATKYPTYFSVKTGDAINFEACMITGAYIPHYEMVTDTLSPSENIPQYHYFTTQALRCNLNGWEKETPKNFTLPRANTENHLCWTSQENISVNNDTTIVVPLVCKPILSVDVVPENTVGIYAYIGNTLIPNIDNQIKTGYYLPNETCNVFTHSTLPGATFEGWYSNTGLVSTNMNYTFKIGYNTHLVAKWTIEAPVTQPYVELSYLLVGADDTSMHNGTATAQYCHNGTTWTDLQNTSIIGFRHTTNDNVELRCPITGSGNLGTPFRFAGFREYFGNTRNPNEDTNLSEGFFSQGGSYTTLGITQPYIGYKLIMSNMENNASYKVYAVYIPEIY